jgi:hypothetical protein
VQQTVAERKKSIWIIIAALLPGWSYRQDKTVSSSKEEEIDGRVTLRVAWVVVSCRRQLDGGITGSSESALFIPSLTRRLAPLRLSSDKWTTTKNSLGQTSRLVVRHSLTSSAPPSRHLF